MKKLLIANRGEIALRIMRTARELGLQTVAVYSEVDRDALHVRYADEAFLLGPAPAAQSYLDVAKILAVAARAGADAIHPGYGFLAENAGFARAVIAAGLLWVGPHPAAIEAMGDKVRARQAMAAAGVPIVPGATEPLGGVAEALRAADEYGLPLALKASGGGGGKGLKVARTRGDIEGAFATAVREAQAYFQNPAVYAERYLDNPKHVELQILADKHGAVVHVGERDCSLQRRHQKLYEETPALVSERVRERLREAGLRAAHAIRYDSVGTIETLVAGDEFYFLEMNTRIQVEHTISEMVSGLDLVREQLRVAAGEALGYEQSDITLRGHAIEVRVNAEDPAENFRPAPGTIAAYREPAGFGVRVDAAATVGTVIAPDYDSLIAKLIVWAPTRDQARARLDRAIDDYAIAGVPTTLAFLHALNDTSSVADGTYGTATLENFARTWQPATWPRSQADGAGTPLLDGGSGDHASADTFRVEVNGKLFSVRMFDRAHRALGMSAAPPSPPAAPRPNRKRASGAVTPPGNATALQATGSVIASPMHGVVVEFAVAPGDVIGENGVIAIVEAMKMMNEVRTHRAGTVAALHASVGETVETNAPLATLA